MDLHALFGEAFNIVMQIATLMLGYVTVLAWPVAALALALLYRRPLVNLINRIRKGTGPGFSFEAESLDVAIDAKLAKQAQRDGTATVPTATVTVPPTPAPAGEAETISIPSDDAGSLPSPNHSLDPDTGFYPRESFEVSEAARSRINRNRIEAAWMALQIAARNTTQPLGFDSDAVGVSRTMRHLAELGYTKVGPWRVASRLERLRATIDAEEQPVSDETASNFVSAASNLKDVLYDVERTIKVKGLRN